MFEKCHIAASYRRLPHPSWTSCICLLLDLLIGMGKNRTCVLGQWPNTHVMCSCEASLPFLQWTLPFAHALEEASLAAYCARSRQAKVKDCNCSLCSWQPTYDFVARLPCVCTMVNNIPDLHDHFGKCEHSYGHWLDLPFAAGADPKLRFFLSHSRSSGEALSVI